jgi:hypothetical protein
MFGKSETGRKWIETSPMITVIREITVARIGRRMKNPDIAIAL